MRWIDVTLPVERGMVTYEGDPAPYLYRYASAAPGVPASYDATLMVLSSHTGTHVDAPRHFVPGGQPVDRIDPDRLCGPATVVDLRGGPRAIGAEALAGLDLAGVERLLLRTDNGELAGKPFTTEYAHLALDGARLLRRAGVRLVGIDYLSIEGAGSAGFEVHHELLDGPEPIVVVEGLDLRGVEAGRYELVVLPLKIAGCDGAPARALLRPVG